MFYRISRRVSGGTSRGIYKSHSQKESLPDVVEESLEEQKKNRKFPHQQLGEVSWGTSDGISEENLNEFLKQLMPN